MLKNLCKFLNIVKQHIIQTNYAFVLKSGWFVCFYCMYDLSLNHHICIKDISVEEDVRVYTWTLTVQFTGTLAFAKDVDLRYMQTACFGDRYLCIGSRLPNRTSLDVGVLLDYHCYVHVRLLMLSVCHLHHSS